MKCKCGNEARMEYLEGDNRGGTIERGYKRMRCRCGKVTPWCGISFIDCREWIREQFAKIREG